MTDSEIFYRLFNGGRYALPWLIKISDSNSNALYFVNNNENIVYDENTYIASSFSYNEPDSSGSGASLDISAVDNSLVEFIENADSMRLDIIGVMVESGEIQPIKNYKHLYGSVSYGSDLKIKFSLSKDDRLDMIFPPYKFDTDTNAGNA